MTRARAGTVRAVAHPNIALAKYWGKKPISGNIPAVPSLSVTLAGMATTTELTFDETLGADALTLNGEPARDDVLFRTVKLLDRVRALSGETRRANVVSRNDFPTASGLASSASGFAALALAATHAAGLELSAEDVALIARESSASAARSLFGGFAELDTDGHARAVAPPSQLDLRVLVCVTTEAKKTIGSTTGMIETAKKSLFYDAWLESAPRLYAEVKAALLARDFPRLGEVAETSALAMHGLAMAAGIVYFTPATTSALAEVRRIRAGGTPAYATIDAGPHVKVLVREKDREAVAARMKQVPGVLRILETQPGEGARIEAGPARAVSS